MKQRATVMNRQTRSGMTLIELMVAIVLCTVLFGAMQAALHTHWKLRNAGAAEVEAARVAWAIQQDFVGDVRGLVSSLSDQTTSADSPRPSQPSALDLRTSRFEERLLNIRPLQFVQPAGVYLRPHVVVLPGLRQNHRFHMPDRHEPAGQCLLTVWWWNQGRENIEIPVGTAEGQTVSLSLKGNRWPRALIRLQLPVSACVENFTSDSPDADDIRAAGGLVDVVDAEDRRISNVRLRCLDSTNWVDRRDPSGSEENPAAIELRLTLGGDALRLVARTDSHD